MVNQKLRPAAAMLMRSHLRSVAIFYGIVLLVYVCLTLVLAVMVRADGLRFNGVEMSSAIFCFVTGCVCFRAYFSMMQTCGLSRKTIFASTVLSFVPLALCMGLLDLVLVRLIALAAPVQTMFQSLYAPAFAGMPLLLTLLAGAVWSAFLYLVLLSVGYLLGVIYYRVSRRVRVVLSAGIPVFIVVVLPALDIYIFHGGLAKLGSQVGLALLGLNGGSPQPLVALAAMLLLSALVLLPAFLIMRRAQVQTN